MGEKTNKVRSDLYLCYMKLLKTIKKIIQEAEQQYNMVCENSANLDEIDRAEKHYQDSLKLLRLYKNKDSRKTVKKK